MANSHSLTEGDKIHVAQAQTLRVIERSKYFGRFHTVHNLVLKQATILAQEASPTLNLILAAVEFENLARTRPTKIAKELGVSLPTVNRHFAKLRALQIIEPDEVDRGRKQGISNWRVHPLLAWSAQANLRERYLNSLPEDHIFCSDNPYPKENLK